jgi:hypothetical protein
MVRVVRGMARRAFARARQALGGILSAEGRVMGAAPKLNDEENEIPALEDDGLSEWDEWAWWDDMGGKESVYEDDYRERHDT